MAKFCGRCGSKLDESNGLCPVCDVEEKTVAVDFVGDAVLESPVATSDDVEKTVALDFTDNKQSVVPATPYASSASEEQSNVVINNTYSAQVNDDINKDNCKPEKENRVKKATPFSTFICIILSICLFITLITSLVIFDVRNTLKEKNAGKLLNNLSVTSALDEFNVDGYNYLDDFYDFLYNDMDRFEVDDKDLDNFIIDSPIRDNIAEKISEFSEEFFEDGDAKFKIKKTDIVNALEDCDEYLENEFDVYPNRQHYEKVADWILVDGDITIVNTRDFDTLSTVNRYGLSYAAVVVLVLLSALMIFAMCKANFRQALVSTGIVFIIVGAIFSIAALIPLFGELYTSSVIILVAGNFFAANWLPSVIILALGILMLVAKKVIKILDSKKKA